MHRLRHGEICTVFKSGSVSCYYVQWAGRQVDGLVGRQAGMGWSCRYVRPARPTRSRKLANGSQPHTGYTTGYTTEYTTAAPFTLARRQGVNPSAQRLNLADCCPVPLHAGRSHCIGHTAGASGEGIRPPLPCKRFGVPVDRIRSVPGLRKSRIRL